MPDRQQRKEAQKAKIAAMPLSKRIAIVIVGTLSAAAAAAVVGLLMSGEPNLGAVMATGITLMAIIGYQYLLAPARQNAEGESR
jgi:hypothetical protein